MDVGTENPIVARLSVGLFDIIKMTRFPDDKKESIQKCCFDIMQALVQAEKAAKPLMDEIKNIETKIATEGVKTQSNGRAIETPGVLLLDNSKIFLKFAKQALQHLAKALGILLEKNFDGPHFHKVLERAKERLGDNHIVTKLLNEDQDWLKEINDLRNEDEHPKSDKKKTVKMSLVEERLTTELFHLLDRPDTYTKVADSYNTMLKQHRKKIPGALSNTIERIDTLELEIANYTKFIRSGHISDVLADNLRRAETELKELQTKRTYLEHQNQNIFATPMSIKKRLVDLGEIFAKKPSEANKVLKRVFPEKIKMEPLTNGAGAYRASGMVNLYGLEQRFTIVQNGVPTGIRTPVTSVKGRCPGPG